MGMKRRDYLRADLLKLTDEEYEEAKIRTSYIETK